MTTTTVQMPASGNLVANANTLLGTATPIQTGSSTLADITLANTTSTGTGIGLEPTLVLDQKARYLNHLHTLRRNNLGDDTTDLPGYGLYLMRMPISLLPGAQSHKGKGASVTVEAKHEPADVDLVWVEPARFGSRVYVRRQTRTVPISSFGNRTSVSTTRCSIRGFAEGFREILGARCDWSFLGSRVRWRGYCQSTGSYLVKLVPRGRLRLRLPWERPALGDGKCEVRPPRLNRPRRVDGSTRPTAQGGGRVAAREREFPRGGVVERTWSWDAGGPVIRGRGEASSA